VSAGAIVSSYEWTEKPGQVSWVQVRVKGSHRQFHHPTKRGTVTVAGKPSIDIPPGTLNSALKQAGLKKAE
jgi:predicted RNA binding protein YcfA (HicA-like mRNA interferase family)